MTTAFPLFDRFAPIIARLDDDDLACHAVLRERLLLADEGRLSVCYAPFDDFNPDARIVIVGITPGMTQMVNALREARNQLRQGADAATCLRAAKRTGAFSGSMREPLIRLLDHVGVATHLGLASCAELFGGAAHLLQTASVLRYPVFVDGENYNGSPKLLSQPLLRNQLAHFAEHADRLPEALFLPLGDKVSDALAHLAAKGVIAPDRVLDGLPHPSGANAERIAYFLGNKRRDALSVKTNPDKLDRARERLVAQVAALG